ncbi:MAG: hypothetical protein JJE30_12455 [Desulfuromonadales bacterium]|nr:hypothetical protein [Desulfuromonadales bacterium]
MKYSYPSEKFSVARHSLMLPHPKGEAESIMHAFHECSLGLHDVDRDSLDDDARKWVHELEELMNTGGLEDPTSKGLWVIKAEQLTIDNKFRLSHIVDELACWFDRADS